MRKLTTTEFIERATLIHGDKYDYTLVDYKNQDTKVEIICRNDSSFYQRPDHHLAGHDRNRCSGNLGKHIERSKKIAEEFISKAKLVHGDKYDYSKVKYVSAKTKVIIICPVHGEFEQTPDNHLSGKNGMKCSIIDNALHQMDTLDEFLEKAILVHGNLYDYSKIQYKGNKIKIEVVCKTHGSFWQAPNNHLMGKGCSACID